MREDKDYHSAGILDDTFSLGSLKRYSGMMISLEIRQEKDSTKQHIVYQEQVFVKIINLKGIYSFAKHLGAAVRDIIPGYYTTSI